jgi:hypothetical protein
MRKHSRQASLVHEVLEDEQNGQGIATPKFRVRRTSRSHLNQMRVSHERHFCKCRVPGRVVGGDDGTSPCVGFPLWSESSGVRR